MLEPWVSDLGVKAFVRRLSDEKLPEREWLESVAAAVANKPPSKWNDSDERRYRVSLSELAGQFRRIEQVALDENADVGEGRVIRLGIMDAAGIEQREVLHVAREEEARVDEAIDALRGVLRSLGLDDRIALAALAGAAERLIVRQIRTRDGDDD